VSTIKPNPWQPSSYEQQAKATRWLTDTERFCGARFGDCVELES